MRRSPNPFRPDSPFRPVRYVALATVYGAVVLLTHAGFGGLACAVGAGLASVSRAVEGRGAAAGLGPTVLYATLAALAAWGVYGFVAHVLDPAYPAIRPIAKSATTPLAITLAFSLLARWDFRWLRPVPTPVPEAEAGVDPGSQVR